MIRMHQKEKAQVNECVLGTLLARHPIDLVFCLTKSG
jgi:hypothetical protein